MLKLERRTIVNRGVGGATKVVRIEGHPKAALEGCAGNRSMVRTKGVGNKKTSKHKYSSVGRLLARRRSDSASSTGSSWLLSTTLILLKREFNLPKEKTCDDLLRGGASLSSGPGTLRLGSLKRNSERKDRSTPEAKKDRKAGDRGEALSSPRLYSGNCKGE